MVVFYGSQTGTAEDLASRLAKDASRFGMKGIALDPEECDMVRRFPNYGSDIVQVYFFDFRKTCRSCQKLRIR